MNGIEKSNATPTIDVEDEIENDEDNENIDDLNEQKKKRGKKSEKLGKSQMIENILLGLKMLIQMILEWHLTIA